MNEEDNILDAKPDAGASSAPADANDKTASSTVDDAKGGQPSFDEQALAETMKNHPAEESAKKADVPPSPSDGKEGQATEPKAPEAGEQKQVEPKKEDDFSHLPFHEHEDFKKLVSSRNEARQQAETLKPLAERQSTIEQYCLSNGITPQQFREALEIQALINSDPTKAAERLKPVFEQLAKFQGTSLPKDLQEQVDAGTLPLEYAQRLARAEATRDFDRSRSEMNERNTRESMVRQALTAWEENVKRSDPDYVRKSSGVLNRFVALSAAHPGMTPDKAIALAQQALEEETKYVSGFLPKAAPTKVLDTRNGSAAITKEEIPKWNDDDAMADAMAKRYSRGVPRR